MHISSMIVFFSFLNIGFSRCLDKGIYEEPQPNNPQSQHDGECMQVTCSFVLLSLYLQSGGKVFIISFITKNISG